jgi:lipid A 3-O-deacylase
MRLGTVTGLSLLLAIVAAPCARAQEWKKPASTPSLLSEFRFGFSAQDPWGMDGRGNSANLTGEILFAKPFTASDLFTSYFIPRPHVGGSLNFDGQTSFAYAGLSWTVDLTPSLFVEGSIGGAFHNGDTKSGGLRRNVESLGCTPLFRESGSVGVRLSANWSVMATLEHLTNAGACSENRGLTNVGARVGYTF